MLDNLDIKTLIADGVNSECESGSQNGLQGVEVGDPTHAREAGDTGNPGETRDPRKRAEDACGTSNPFV